MSTTSDCSPGTHPRASLTDETIRRNYELYGHPDGRQEVSMGIALPSWIVEGKNNIWVLGVYAVLIGGLLPAMVGRWWFGSRGTTKDGIEARTAEGFWKGIEETSGISDIVKVAGSAFRHESQAKNAGDLSKVEKEIERRAGDEWKEMSKAVAGDEKARRALALLYAHFLRLDLGSKALERGRHPIALASRMGLMRVRTIVVAPSNTRTAKRLFEHCVCSELARTDPRCHASPCIPRAGIGPRQGYSRTSPAAWIRRCNPEFRKARPSHICARLEGEWG